MSDDTIAPCPFCAATGSERLFELWSSFDAGHVAHIHCMRCGADGPSKYSEAGAPDAIRQARTAWQARAAAKVGDGKDETP